MIPTDLAGPLDNCASGVNVTMLIYIYLLTESAQLRSYAASSIPFHMHHMIPVHIPALTCFIPSLPAGFPFRISIHCWDPPVPSRSTMDLANGNAMVIFEARVLIDGVCVSYVRHFIGASLAE